MQNILFWNERGQIGCTQKGHAPFPGTDTWLFERWKKITPPEKVAFERELGHPVRCEVCAAEERSRP